jgi:hypothetical protein
MKRSYSKRLAVLICVTGLLCMAGLSFSDEGSWRDEFNSLCGNTQEAMALSLDELNEHMERCDKLSDAIKKSDDPKKKAYLFRLKKCRSFYKYIIDSINSGRFE